MAALVQWLHYTHCRNFSMRNERPSIRPAKITMFECWSHKATTMPTIQRFARCQIAMYFNDDPRPHFHIRATSGEAKYRIDTLQRIVGEIDRRDTDEALGWAGSNRAILWAKRAELNEEEP